MGECEIGCKEYPESSKLSECVEICAVKACASDLNPQIGTNQMYSCPHACKIRDLSVDQTTCLQHCQRTGWSGCHPKVEGFTFNLCGPPRPVDQCTKHPSIEECEIGCKEYPDSSEDCRDKVICSEDAMFCDKDGTFSDCSINGLYCDSDGCKYDVDNDSTIGEDFDKEKYQELHDFLTEHLVSQDNPL